MFKRIKSLLIAGVMVLGMTGAAFANGNGNDGCQLEGLRGQHNGDQHKIEKVAIDDWKAYMNQVNSMNSGVVIEPQQKNWEDKAAGPSEGWIEFKVYADKDFDHVKDNNKQIEVIHIKFNVALTDEDKFEKNKEDLPGLPEKEPETGDTSLFVYGAVALASAAGLYVINNKKDKKDDEE